MATAGELTKSISDATGIPISTATQTVRILREARLVSTGARGVNAPAMTSLDVARVLISLLASNRPGDAAACVRDFGGLLAHEIEAEKGQPQTALNFPATPNQTLEQYLAALVDEWNRRDLSFPAAGVGVEIEVNRLVAEVNTVSHNCVFLHVLSLVRPEDASHRAYEAYINRISGYANLVAEYSRVKITTVRRIDGLVFDAIAKAIR